MKDVRFEWDRKKDLANFRNHGVEFYDVDHSLKEARFLMIGLSSKFRILLVNYTLRKGMYEDLIRIISSRKATKNEQKVYFERSI